MHTSNLTKNNSFLTFATFSRTYSAEEEVSGLCVERMIQRNGENYVG